MGERLQRTAVSTNIKERLDFSCALLDPAGELVVNAPHIPVHLGALGPLRAAPARDDRHGAGRRGDDQPPRLRRLPPAGRDGGDPRLRGKRRSAPRLRRQPRPSRRDRGDPPGLDASRRAAADRGGGGDPSDVSAPEGRGPLGRVRAAFSWRRRSRPGPSRKIWQTCVPPWRPTTAGPRRCRASPASTDARRSDRYMAALKARAEERLRAALARLPAGRYEAVERLDDGAPIAARIEDRRPRRRSRADRRFRRLRRRPSGKPQRAARRRAQRRALRPPPADRRAPAVERGHPPRGRDPHPARDAESAVPGRSRRGARRRGRQRRDQPAGGRHPAQGARARSPAARAR